MAVSSHRYPLLHASAAQARDIVGFINGQAQAEALLERLRTSLGSGDELFEFIWMLMHVRNDDACLRGACRHLQKTIQRAL